MMLSYFAGFIDQLASTASAVLAVRRMGNGAEFQHDGARDSRLAFP